MDEEQKKSVAVFRHGVIADFVDGTEFPRGERRRLMREKCARKWRVPGSTRTRISLSTLKEWIRRYVALGYKLESLYPKEREDRGRSRAVDDETAAGFVALRKEMPNVTIPVLIRIARERKIILPGTRIAHATMYRFLKARGLMDQSYALPKDEQKFDAGQPNDLWQSDVMHGPNVLVDGRQRKTYLIAFIDDHSLLIPHAEFFLSERLNNFLDALQKALLMRGLPNKLYLDSNPAFRSLHLGHICASLGIELIHANLCRTEGKRRIERFFLSVQTGFLPLLKAATLSELNVALSDWVRQYHERIHSTIKETPLSRFTLGLACVRHAPSDLDDHFRKKR